MKVFLIGLTLLSLFGCSGKDMQELGQVRPAASDRGRSDSGA